MGKLFEGADSGSLQNAGNFWADAFDNLQVSFLAVVPFWFAQHGALCHFGSGCF